MSDTPTILRLEDRRLSLEHQGHFHDRDFGAEDAALLDQLAGAYQQALYQTDDQVRLLDIGRRLYAWLDRDGWLRGLRPRPSGYDHSVRWSFGTHPGMVVPSVGDRSTS